MFLQENAIKDQLYGIELSSLTVNKLKTECSKRDLDTRGLKANLVLRLQTYLEEKSAEKIEKPLEQLEDPAELPNDESERSVNVSFVFFSTGFYMTC